MRLVLIQIDSFAPHHPNAHILSFYRYHFSSLAHDNSALSSEVDSVSSPFPLPSSSHSPYKPPPAVAKQGEDDDSITHLYATLEGTQVVSKFNLSEEEADLVKIFLAVIRVDLHEPSPANPQITRGADITVTINVPLGRATQIKAAQGILDANVKELEVKAKQWFQQAVQDFKIVDYGLFA